MHNTLARYKIGLGVIGGLTLILLIVILVQAGAVKQDTKTFATAEDIATSLNTYIDTNGKIPTSLSEAKVRDVPDAIKYQRLAGERYKFCVTYKTADSGFDAATALTEAYYGSYTPDNTYEKNALYLDSTHKKGENCQTISPYLADPNAYDYSTDSSGASSSQLDVTTTPNTTTAPTSGSGTAVYTDPTTGCTYNAGGGSAENKRYYDCIDNAVVKPAN